MQTIPPHAIETKPMQIKYLIQYSTLERERVAVGVPHTQQHIATTIHCAKASLRSLRISLLFHRHHFGLVSRCSQLYRLTVTVMLLLSTSSTGGRSWQRTSVSDR